jgi:hypothetical protein
MDSFKIVGLVVVACLVALAVEAYVVFGAGGPGGSLVKSVAELELKKHAKECLVSKVSYVRGGKFVPQSHRKAPHGTAFYPIRVEEDFTTALADGSRSEKKQATKTFYFYKDSSGKWEYEINSF